jgi:hypothetical protein
MGFRATRDPYLFFNNDTKAIIAIYIDNILITASTIKNINSIKAGLSEKYKMKDLGEAK